MRRLLLVITVLSWVAATAAASADEVDDFINAQLRAQRIPGLALAVVKDGRIVKVAGYGVADRTTNSPVAVDTIFKIGSISKPILATAGHASRGGWPHRPRCGGAHLPARMRRRPGTGSPFVTCSRTPRDWFAMRMISIR